MRAIFISLMARFPIAANLVILVFSSLVFFLLFSNNDNYLNIDVKWLSWTAGITSALLAQIYFKLNETKFISNTSVAELNRVNDKVKLYTKPIIKLVLLHVGFAVLSNIVFSLNLPDVTNAIAISVALACLPLCILSLLFGYMIHDDLTDFYSDIIKRHLERTSRKESQQALKSKIS